MEEKLLYLQKIEKEICDLSEKIFKLQEFIDSNKFYELNETQQDLLKIQIIAMKNYFYILDTRRKHM